VWSVVSLAFIILGEKKLSQWRRGIQPRGREAFLSAKEPLSSEELGKRVSAPGG